MSVRRRGDGRWQIDIVVWQDGKRVRVKKAAHAKNKAEALEVESTERLRLAAGGGSLPKAGATVAEFAKTFVADYAAANNKPSELRSKRMILERHIVPFFGKLTLEQVTPHQVERYKAAKLGEEKPPKPKTINNHLIVLRRMLAVAREWGLLAGAVPTVRLLKSPPPKFTFLDFDEARRLVEATDPDWRPMALVALRTGLRLGELLALRWEDVDLVAGRIMVRRTVCREVVGTPKGGRAREVPLSDEARASLRALPSRFAGALVFPGPGGKHRHASACRPPLVAACRRAGLQHVQWHGLRHTFASHLVMRGVPLKAVQELLGHANIEMTMRYAHLSPTIRRDAVALLDAPAPLEAGTETRERSGNDRR